jgi:hypothetical protein
VFLRVHPNDETCRSSFVSVRKVALMHDTNRSLRICALLLALAALTPLSGCTGTSDTQHQERQGGMDHERPDPGMGGGMHGGMGGGM